MICQYCENDRKLLKAHILPRSFHKHLNADGDNPILVPGDTGKHVTTSRIGEYDPSILCEECEKKFGPYDDYGKKFFLDTNWDLLPRRSGWHDRIIEAPDADYRLLKLFVLSVLLRAHWTNRPFYGVVNIGEKHAKALRDMIERGDAGDAQRYGTTVFRFEPTGTDLDPKLGWRNPEVFRVEGIEIWRLWFHQFGALIKVDRRSLPHPLSHLVLDPAQKVRIVTRDFLSSRELQSMLQTTMARESVD